MGGVAAIVTTVVATASAVALFRFAESKRQEIKDMLNQARRAGDRDREIIDYERDPETGVYKPKS